MGGVIPLIKGSLKKIRRLTRTSPNPVQVTLIRRNWFLAKNTYAVCRYSLKNFGVKIVWCGNVHSVQLTDCKHFTPVRKSFQPRYLGESVQPLISCVNKPDQLGMRYEFESRHKVVCSNPSRSNNAPAQRLRAQCKKGGWNRQPRVQG